MRTTYHISYKTAGNEHFDPNITWYLQVHANSAYEALEKLMDIERARVAEIVDIHSQKVTR